MEKTVIEINNLSKKYNLNSTSSYLTFRDKLSNIVLNPLELIKIFSRKKIFFLALDNINLKINKGEVLGIIGANGSGKSTLLKIISRVTQPSSGSIKIKEKLSSILEVGTGFHPELTGRENIFFSGAILGMSKIEIKNNFDKIIKFSEVGKFIDIPVKKYSSGMYVRLAFSVSIYLESDIILIDEVLAVGDLSFQKKCLDKIYEMNNNLNKTIIFVSHNLEAVQKICKRCLFLNNGKIKDIGKTEDIIKQYLLHFSIGKNNKNKKIIEGDAKVRINNFKISNSFDEEIINSGDKLKMAIKFSKNFKLFKKCRFVVGIYDEFSKLLLRIDSENLNINLFKNNKIIITTDKINFGSVSCYVNVALFIDNVLSERIVNIDRFDVINKQNYNMSDKPLLITNFSIKY